jgi:hypothetical protein
MFYITLELNVDICLILPGQLAEQHEAAVDPMKLISQALNLWVEKTESISLCGFDSNSNLQSLIGNLY